MVIVNNNIDKQVINCSRFAENIAAFTQGKDVLTNNTISVKNTIEIKGQSSLILELN